MDTTMPARKFTTRRSWHNSLLLIWLLPFLLLVSVLALALYGSFIAFFFTGVFLLFALPIAIARDAGNRSTYSFRNDHLILADGISRKEIPVQQIIDASPIDRIAARDYIMERVAAVNVRRKEQRRMIKGFTRYCTVDIGMTSFTGGMGRSLIDRLPGSRYDLVLVRMHGGEDLLLSPKYLQDMVDAINRQIASRAFR